MAKKLLPIKRRGRFYFDKNHKTESFLFGTIPSTIRSFFKRPFKIPQDHRLWVEQHVIDLYCTKPRVTWLGHSSFLIQIQEINILVDPIFDSPSFLYPRMLPLGIKYNELPPIDGVLISHNHRDHMDEKSLLYIKKRNNNKTQLLVPWGDKRWFDTRDFEHVYEFEWEQSHVLINHARSTQVTCTFVPAHHWSQRGLFDKNRSLWGGWVIHTDEYQIYFVGDTAYSSDCFARINYLFPRINIALVPIGPGEPRSWMKHSHVDACEAGRLFLEVGAEYMIPMHWGTFSFGNDQFDEPLLRLQHWWELNKQVLRTKQLKVLKVGQRFDIPVSTVYQGHDSRKNTSVVTASAIVAPI